ncbi:hypothetical protein [Eubacterium callanderi]|uniref:hypothetical protein n=1 Tax=Eubacterium callanderi TaxID=53442 RepID=UPI003AB319F6
MINLRNLAYILVLGLGIGLFGVGLSLHNSDALNASYSVLTGWIVGFLCSIHDKEKRKDLIKDLKLLKNKKTILCNAEKNLYEIWSCYANICEPVFRKLGKDRIQKNLFGKWDGIMMLAFWDCEIYTDNEKLFLNGIVHKTKDFYIDLNDYLMQNPDCSDEDIMGVILDGSKWMDEGRKIGSISKTVRDDIFSLENKIEEKEIELM